MKIGLGAVQFGQHYGVSNKNGMTLAGEVREILAFAWENGVTMLDTAPAYGISEEVLGGGMPAHADFRIVTKTPVFPEEKIEKEDAARLKDAFYRSLCKLRKPGLYGLLVHHAADLLKEGGPYLWEAMQDLKQEGLVQKIGASLTSPLDLHCLLDQYTPDIVQTPMNIFDQRMLKSGHLQRLKQGSVEIHCRSAFLQGLLLMHPDDLPDYFQSVRPLLIQYRRDLQAIKKSPLEAALCFLDRQMDIDQIIVGVNNKKQLVELLQAVHTQDSFAGMDFSAYAVSDASIIDPSLWKLS